MVCRIFLRLTLGFIVLLGSPVFSQNSYYVSAGASKPEAPGFQSQTSSQGSETSKSSADGKCKTISETENEEQIDIFPDPFTSRISVQVLGGWTIGLFDSNDKCIETKWAYENGVCTLETAGLKPGFYFVTVKKQNGKTITRKLMKQ